MITIDLQKVEQIERLLSQTPEQVRRVLATSINSAALHARRRAAASVRKEYVVERLGVIEDLKMVRATPGYLRANLKSTGRPIPMIKFDTTPRFPDAMIVRSRVKKSSSQKSFKQAFVARMKSGHLNVFERTSARSFPIEGFYSPSVPQMYGNEEVIQNVEEAAEERLDRDLSKAIERMLWG